MTVEVSTELTISSFPAWDSKAEVEMSFLSTFWTKGKKSSILDFVEPRGRPKYVKGMLPS
jgi:hypothetical protein